MSCGDPMCQCGCGGYLGQCRRTAERVDRTWGLTADSWESISRERTQRLDVANADLARVRARIVEYIADLDLYQEASLALYRAESGGAAGARGLLGPGLDRLRQKLNVHQAWLKGFACKAMEDGQ